MPERLPLRGVLFLLRLIPPGFLIVLFVVGILDRIDTAPFTSGPLARHPGQWAVCVGGGEDQRIYLLVPGFLHHPSLLVVSRDRDTGNVAASAEAGAFWFLVAVVAACIWGTWRLWIRPIRTRGWQRFRSTL